MDKIRVLLVDDHPLAREGLRTMLSTASDIEVVAEASDGVEAVERADEHQPEIILMDVRMPNMDGLEATRRIKSRLPSVSVIVLTAYDNDAYIVDAVRSGAGGYLLKDASKDLLIHTIRAVNSGGMLIKSSLFREAVLGWSDASGSLLKEKSAASAMLEELTPRERDVLRHMIEGRTNRQIGQALFISEDTAKKHVQAIMLKLGVSDRTQAAVKAVRSGLLDLFPG
ncbi:MAG: response regulator transcription factor, partial [Dehalococcoidales bacterium]|nr:response regulator transcription factor [Dehalococcoidales bacterium]